MKSHSAEDREEKLAAERTRFAQGEFSEVVLRATLMGMGLKPLEIDEQVDLATMEWIRESKKNHRTIAMEDYLKR